MAEPRDVFRAAKHKVTRRYSEFVALHESTSLALLYEQMREHYSCCLGLGTQCPGYDADGKSVHEGRRTWPKQNHLLGRRPRGPYVVIEEVDT